MARLASCVCGALRATCVGEPRKVSLCHCLACQRRTGSTYGVAAFFDRQNVQVDGQRTSYSRQSDGGLPVTFHFCPLCGSTVYWEPQRLPDLIAVGLGSFADPDFPAPTQAVYDEHRHPWVNIVI
ncbi:GFA family protein [Rhizobium laguerreae]|uniref:GFA family protein n=1 Tax=Rhizobium laguerreae TaxID=1076926 RepID=A0AB35FNU1_9HYPH|nr:GFA family protein [Rhizobium laguerreae]MBY3068274.1 GFA family protein [Rhizobium laguerreae]